MRKTIAVIGLGRFGKDFIRALSEQNVDVIGVDLDKANVALVGEYINNVVVCDSTNVDALVQAGVNEADEAVVAFGQDTKANIAMTILTVVALKKIGIKKVTCRIDDSSYEDLLKRVGADSCISPFELASQSLALRISTSSVIDYYHITEGYNVFEIVIKNNVPAIKLTELDARHQFGVNIILYSRGAKQESPNLDYVIMPKDHIFVFGKQDGVSKLNEFLDQAAAKNIKGQQVD